MAAPTPDFVGPAATLEELCKGCTKVIAARVPAGSRVHAASILTSPSESPLPHGSRLAPNLEYHLVLHTHAGWFRRGLGWSGEGSGWKGPFAVSFEVQGLVLRADQVEVRACENPPCPTTTFSVDAKGVPSRAPTAP